MAKLDKVLKIGGALLTTAGGVAGAIQVVDTVVESYTINEIHEITTISTYKIDGVEVSLDEFNSYLGTTEKETETSSITFTANDLDIDGVARLSNYIDFEFDIYGNVDGAKVLSNKIDTIEYVYSENIMSYVVGETFTGIENGSSYYQDTTKEDGIYFTVGSNEGIEYELVNEIDAISGTYIFKFIDNDSYANITFADVFESITLNLK